MRQYKNHSEFYYLYKWTNLINGKIYIGQTNDHNRRYSQYKYSAKKEDNSDFVIVRAMQKYKFDNFKYDVIITAVSVDDINELEIAAIAQYNSTNPEIGYNKHPGGNHHPHSEETCTKISEALTDYYKINKHHLKDVPMTQEHKDNISKASMGKPGTNLGKTFDEEWKAKIGKSNEKQVKATHKFTEEQEKEICDLYVAGASTYKIANMSKFDCYRPTINDVLLRNNISIRQSNYTGHSNGKNKFTEEQENEICKLYSDGWTMAKIGRKFENCRNNTLRSILIRKGFKKA